MYSVRGVGKQKLFSISMELYFTEISINQLSIEHKDLWRVYKMDNTILGLTIQKYLDSKNIVTGDGDMKAEDCVFRVPRFPHRNTLRGQTQSMLHSSKQGIAIPSHLCTLHPLGLLWEQPICFVV